MIRATCLIACMALALAACGAAPNGPPAGVPDANRLAPGYTNNE